MPIDDPQGFGFLPPGTAPFADRPASPRGLYREFGMPERPLRIHFPNKEKTTQSLPWYWYVPRQAQYSFVYLAAPWWGIGWERRPIFPVIKILPIDTQPLRPMPPYGFPTLEDAVQTNPNDPTDGVWGTLNFSNERLWALLANNGEQNQDMPKSGKPKFDIKRGVLVARDPKVNLKALITQAAHQFESNYAGDATDYNTTAATTLLNPSDFTQPAGFHYQHVHGRFPVEQPSGPPATLSGFGNEISGFLNFPPPYGNSARYLSSLPISACFNFNTITTSATAFTIKVGQLDPRKWNMSVFPPLDATIIGNGIASGISGDYSGALSPEPFPTFNASG